MEKKELFGLKNKHSLIFSSFWASAKNLLCILLVILSIAKNPEKHETNGFFGRYALSEWQARHLFCHSEHLRRILGVYLSTRVLFHFQNTPHSNPESLSSLNQGCPQSHTIWKSHPWRSDLFSRYLVQMRSALKIGSFFFFIEHSS